MMCGKDTEPEKKLKVPETLNPKINACSAIQKPIELKRNTPKTLDIETGKPKRRARQPQSLERVTVSQKR